jgi:hypothetical protein
VMHQALALNGGTLARVHPGLLLGLLLEGSW